ncbi:MAG TPA: hypothetical protein VIN40_07885 [Candidatus Tyrphobacter sp.]
MRLPVGVFSLYRLLAGIILVIACTSPLRAQPHAGLAPADEYFGRMKMSILGIRNGLQTEYLRIAGNPRRASSQLAACHWLENAIEDWGSKYPRDTWLPHMALALEGLYDRVRTPSGRARLTHLIAWMGVHLPYSKPHSRRAAHIAVR